MDVAPLPRLPGGASETFTSGHDVLLPMLDAEEILLAQGDHLELASLERGFAPNSLWREKVSLWMFDVADHMHERRSIVYYAMNILDRYCIGTLGKGKIMCESSYEKASLAAIFLAMRIAGSVEIQLEEIIRMSRRGVTSQELIDAGTDMVRRLSWEQRLVTPQEFITALLMFVPSTERHSAILDGAFYLTELAVCDACLARHKASDVALAAFLNIVTADRGGDARCTIKAIRESSPMDPDSKSIREVRSRLHRLYCLSFESIDKAIPHVVSDDESDCPRDFMSSCATRTISEENLLALTVPAEAFVQKRAFSRSRDLLESTHKRHKHG